MIKKGKSYSIYETMFENEIKDIDKRFKSKLNICIEDIVSYIDKSDV